MPYKRRTDLRQSGHIIFKKTIIDGTYQRYELEYYICQHKWYQENISPLIIAGHSASFFSSSDPSSVSENMKAASACLAARQAQPELPAVAPNFHPCAISKSTCSYS